MGSGEQSSPSPDAIGNLRNGFRSTLGTAICQAAVCNPADLKMDRSLRRFERESVFALPVGFRGGNRVVVGAQLEIGGRGYVDDDRGTWVKLQRGGGDKYR